MTISLASFTATHAVLASASNLLSSPLANSYLDAYKARPETGEFIVPLITADPSQEGDLVIDTEALAPHNGARFVRQLQDRFAEVAAMGKVLIDEPLPATEGRWRVLSMHSPHLISFLGPRHQLRLRARTHGREMQVGIQYGEGYFNVSHTMRVGGANWDVIELGSYTFHISAVLVEGLKRFIGLEDNYPIDQLTPALYRALGFDGVPHFQPELSYAAEEPTVSGVGERHEVLLSAGLLTEQRLLGINTEHVNINIHPDQRTDDRSLTPTQLKLWNWVRTQRDPTEAELEAYHERTAARYGPGTNRDEEA